MSYELSFSPEFFLSEEEPYDRADLAVNSKGEPISVYSALCMMQKNDRNRWADLAREVFALSQPEYLNAETVLEKVQETNTCTNLSSPVEVWIDPEGTYTVLVYDGN